MASFGIEHILSNLEYFKKCFHISKTNETVKLVIADLMDKVIISNELINIINDSEYVYSLNKINAIEQPKTGDLLFKYQYLTQYIFKNIFDIAFYFADPNNKLQSNVYAEMPYDIIAINAIHQFSFYTGLNICIYSDIAIPGFKPINLNINNNKNGEIKKFINVINYKDNIKIKKLEFNGDKLYYRTIKKEGWFNRADYTSDKTIIAKFIRIKWFPLLLPIAMAKDSINIPYLNKYIWNFFNNTIKLKVGFNILYSIMYLHPKQLAGVTNNILFRYEIEGNENYLNNFKYIYKSSVRQWCISNNFDNFYGAVYDLLQYDYNYCGKNKLFKILRDALIYLDHTALDMLEFPKNIRVLMFLVDKIVAKDKYAIIAGNKLGNVYKDKIKHIEKFLRAI